MNRRGLADRKRRAESIKKGRKLRRRQTIVELSLSGSWTKQVVWLVTRGRGIGKRKWG